MFLTGGFESVLRGIAIVLCNWIYGLIPNLFSIFYYLADSRFINSEIIKTFSTNIYVLISVVMLFAFAVKLLQAIVIPDMLSDSKKGVAGVAKRVFIALTLVILIPFAFDQLYELQHQVVSNSLIEKLLVGMQNESGDNNVGESSNAGQVLAAMTISGLLYPEDGATTTSENLQTNYNSMINSNIEDMSLLIPNINETYVDSNGNEKYVLNFNSLIALIVGVFVVYMLILFCFDTALRFIKLGFLELTAPISIMAYIYNGTEFLNKWFKETLNTFVTLFVRIAALSLLIYGMHILPQFMENFKDVKGKFWIQLFIIVGLLTFAKAAPDLIKTITGVTMKGGGVSRRLGEMAAVGAIAQNAWKSVGKTASGVAKTAVMAPFGAVGGASKAAARGIDNKFFSGKGAALVSRVKDSKFGGVMSGIGASIKAGGGMKGAKAFSEALDKNQSFATSKYLNEKEKADALRDKNNTIARNSINSKTGETIFDSSGNIDITKLAAAGGALTAISKGIENLSIRESGKDTVSNYLKKYDAKVTADNNNRISQEVNQRFKQAINATNDQNVKFSINQMLDKFNSGDVTSQQLKHLMMSVKDSSGNRVFNNLSISEISSMTTEMAGGNATVKVDNKTSIENAVTDTTTAFSIAEDSYNKLNESIGNKSSEVKAYVKAGKAMIKKEKNL